MESKVCTKCKEEKLLDCFYNHPDGKFGKDSKCKECQKRVFKEYQKKNKEYFARHSQEYRDRNGNTYKERARNSKYKMTYGITVEDYNTMFKEQEGKCLICKGTDSFSRSKHLHVDHCHKTGKVRGLLCNKCNQGIGAFNDNIKLLEVAITYLNNNKMIEA